MFNFIKNSVFFNQLLIFIQTIPDICCMKACRLHATGFFVPLNAGMKKVAVPFDGKCPNVFLFTF
jgi:hypothetical protein